MNLVKLFTKEEYVAGLEISDGFLRFALVARNYENKREVYIKELIEEPLEDGVVDAGELKDKEKLAISLQKILSRSASKINYAIVSIPHSNIYSKMFSFPKAIAGEKLTDAMRVAVNFNLPVKPESVYVDWETVPSENKNELVLATAQKSIIDAYIEAVNAANLTAIAFESHLFSMLRVIDLDASSPILIALMGKADTLFVVLKNKAVRFARSVKKAMSKEDAEEEAKKISDFYETEDRPVSKIIYSSEIKLPRKFLNYPKILDEDKEGKNTGRWLVSLGAAMRGLMPRSEDTLISLMPVGTEEAYAKQEKGIFMELLLDISSFVAIFITIAFAVILGIIISLKNTIDKNIGTASFPVSADSQKIEEKAIKLNKAINMLSEIYNKNPKFSPILEEIKAMEIKGITITSLSISGTESINIKIDGLGAVRENLSSFRKTLEDSLLFTNVQLPPSNFNIKKNIPFTATFSLEDPRILYK